MKQQQIQYNITMNKLEQENLLAKDFNVTIKNTDIPLEKQIAIKAMILLRSGSLTYSEMVDEIERLFNVKGVTVYTIIESLKETHKIVFKGGGDMISAFAQAISGLHVKDPTRTVKIQTGKAGFELFNNAMQNAIGIPQNRI
jgi:hypothetical protein